MCDESDTETDELPTVSCLMVTADRQHLCRRAVRCYERQTYPNRELVVVDDGEQDLSPVFETVPDGDLVHVQLPSEKNHVLGRLRNVALEAATGQFLAQWDDDDWYHPNRIEKQVRTLRDGYDACCLRGTLMHVDTPRYVNRPYIGYLQDGVPGTIIHRRVSDIRYPEMRREEDTAYLEKWKERRHTKITSGTHLFIRCFHGKNTWEKNHFLTRIRNTIPDAVAYVWYEYICDDLFQHPRFQLREEDHQAFERYLEDSIELGLLNSNCA